MGKSSERAQKTLARLKITSAVKAIGSGTTRHRAGKGWGGARDMSNAVRTPVTPALGFLYEEGGIACRDPPKCRSRNFRSQMAAKAKALAATQKHDKDGSGKGRKK